jgi:hypothetical protein
LLTAAFVILNVITSFVIPQIPDSFQLLMGISNGVYLGSKLSKPTATAKKSPTTQSPGDGTQPGPAAPGAAGLVGAAPVAGPVLPQPAPAPVSSGGIVGAAPTAAAPVPSPALASDGLVGPAPVPAPIDHP